MELTQRLECTQELYGSRTETVCPAEIGYLGICGQTYPVKKGPNKIGRDPETCNIILKLESISRQHAVINILNSDEYMLMDLGSANKTQLENKILQPYIPYPLRNGDTVQFGKVFGIFRLLEDDNDLPMTQAIEIPETPIHTRHVSKLNNIHGTTIPESPDVSDMDESFILSTQSKANDMFKSPNNNFIKSSGRIISIQPIGLKKIDNVYWSSTKKSESFTSNGNNSLLNGSCTTDKLSKEIVDDENIFEMETQRPNCHNKSIESTFNTNSQIPFRKPKISATNIPLTKKLSAISNIPNQLLSIQQNESSDAIFDANTQIPDIFPLSNIHSTKTHMPSPIKIPPVSTTQHQDPHTSDHNASSDSIYNANTQLFEKIPSPTMYNKETQMCNAENLPAVCKINDQQNVQFDLVTDNKEYDNSIYNAITQVDINLLQNKKKDEENGDNSNDIILFDEIDNEPLMDECESQTLLSSELGFLKSNNLQKYNETKQSLEQKECATRSNMLKSEKSRDCEDIYLMMTQRISDKLIDEDLTDCEDELEFNLRPEKNVFKVLDDEDITDCEDDQEQKEIRNHSKESNKSVTDMNFEDLATQVIEGDLASKTENTNQTDFEDMLTQIVVEDIVNHNNSTVKANIDDLDTQIINQDRNVLKENANKQNVGLFKIPLPSPLKSKKRDITKLNTSKPESLNTSKFKISHEDDEIFYLSTQDMLNDLCTQKESSPKLILENKISPLNHEVSIKDNTMTVQNMNVLKKKSTDGDADEKVNDFVLSLSSQQIREVIGVEKEVTKLKQTNTDSSSDIELTPKKNHPFRFMETDLPNSQEIKRGVSVTSKNITTESSSETDTDHDSEQSTPILFRNNKKKKKSAKRDLMKKIDINSLPSRIITRVRKPTSKAIDSLNLSKNILKPKYLTEQEENIDKEIIIENISRLKKKFEKSKAVTENKKLFPNKDDTKKNNKAVERGKKERTSIKRCKDKFKDKSDSKINISGTNCVTDENSESNHRSNRTTRSTKTNRDSNNRNHSKSPEKTSSSDNTVKDTRTHKKGRDKAKLLPEKETRRSTRHKKSDKYEDTQSNKTNESTHEDSTVYTISSESGIDTPYKFKRPATFETEMPFAKKLKTDTCATSRPSRSTPMRKVKKQYVLFTAFPCDEIKMKLEKLGAVIVTNVMECTVVLTLQIKRTFKLLCAVGLGKPIVGPSWVQACVDNGIIVDPSLYLMKDTATENRFQFNLKKTLVGKRNFLRGYKVSCTPSVMPNAQEMELIVKCSGGVWKTGGRHWLCVSCSADKALWPQLQKNGAIVVSSELILGGVLKQKLEIERNRLV